MDYGYPIYYAMPDYYQNIHENMIYYYPTMQYPYPYPQPQPISQYQSDNIQQQQSQFYKLFQQKLKNTSSKYNKKIWTKAQDNLLLQLKNLNFKWTQISQSISDTNPQVCKRRYQRIKQDEEKWPELIQIQIKNVCSRKNIKWQQKMDILYGKFPQIRSYSKKMIKQRYLTYLEERIQQKPWSLEEDLLLVKMLKNGVKKWKKIVLQFTGRTQLQLKNRYYGCLRKIWKKVDRMIQKKR